VYALAGCVYVSQTGPGPSSEALPPLDDSRLSRLLHTDDGLGRAMVVEDAGLALTSRLDLIEAAESSIDLQYFIWQNDPSGIFVIDRLLAAADRGVRVRALIDDVQLEGLVSRINAITKHPNIEVRIFNPFSVRFGMRLRLFRLAEFAIDGNRLNHRMHNKLLVADNQAAILGGRNIGDDYFGRSVKRNFIDTDMLLRLELFELDLEAVRARIRERLEEHPELDRLIDPERVEVLARSLLDAHRLEAAEPVLDDPDVGWGQLPDEVASALTELARCCDSEILIVSPYLVLTPALIEIGDELENRGVRVAVVTNSLESNDVVIAHAAYARFRGAVLDSGAALYEFRGDPAMARDDPAEDISLHSKYILFDDDTVFIGSPNLDPRSLRLNTELGVVLKSPSLVAELKETFTHLTSGENSWRVRRSEDGFEWESAKGTVYRQPAKSGWQRFRSWLLMLLPVTNQL
jgi:putative cardiolipin synthase